MFFLIEKKNIENFSNKKNIQKKMKILVMEKMVQLVKPSQPVGQVGEKFRYFFQKGREIFLNENNLVPFPTSPIG